MASQSWMDKTVTPGSAWIPVLASGLVLTIGSLFLVYYSATVMRIPAGAPLIAMGYLFAVFGVLLVIGSLLHRALGSAKVK